MRLLTGVLSNVAQTFLSAVSPTFLSAGAPVALAPSADCEGLQVGKPAIRQTRMSALHREGRLAGLGQDPLTPSLTRAQGWANRAATGTVRPLSRRDSACSPGCQRPTSLKAPDSRWRTSTVLASGSISQYSWTP